MQPVDQCQCPVLARLQTLCSSQHMDLAAFLAYKLQEKALCVVSLCLSVKILPTWTVPTSQVLTAGTCCAA